MVGVANLSKYLDSRDKNGNRVGDWATAAGKSQASCRFCNIVISFKKGKMNLLQHSESKKHLKSRGEGTAEAQRSVADLFNAQEDVNKEAEDIKEKARKLEILIVASLARHQISLDFVECLTPLLKQSLPDCEIVQKMTLSREKARYLAAEGLAPIFEAETVKMLRECDAFVVSFDETAINKEEEMEIIVKLAHPETGLEMRHYRTVALEAGDAETITETLLETLEDDMIDYEKTMISTMTDWCSVMAGSNTGANKRLSDKIPELIVTGGCPAHHIGNTIQAFVKTFDPDLKDALVNLSECVSGDKGRSLKQMNEFEKVSREIVGKEPKKIRKFVATRWRSIRHCAQDALEMEDVIFTYLKRVKRPTVRQKKLQQYFVEQREMAQLKLRFVVAATRAFDEAIDYFEGNEEHAHEIYEKMESILVSQLQRVMKEEELRCVDDEDNITLKDPSELLKTNLDDKSKQRKDNTMFIGQMTEKMIKSLGLDPISPQLKWFFDSVRAAHIEASRRLIKYFTIGLSSKELKYMSALGPKNRSKLDTVRRIKYLSRRFSKTVDRIDVVSGQDRIEEEALRYCEDDDIMDIRKEKYSEYWEGVRDMKDGSADWQRYKVLPRFALAMGTLLNSNSPGERMFSIQSSIGNNKAKNRLKQDTLDAMLQIREGIESKRAKDACPKCAAVRVDKSIVPRQHCHCQFLELSDTLLQSCKSAGRRVLNKRRENREITEHEQEKMKEIRKKFEDELKENEKQFINKVKQRNILLPPNRMIRVVFYEKAATGKGGSKTGVGAGKIGLGAKTGLGAAKTGLGAAKTGLGAAKTGLGATKDDLGASKGDLRPSKAGVGATKDRLGAGKSALRPANAGVGDAKGDLRPAKAVEDDFGAALAAMKAGLGGAKSKGGVGSEAGRLADLKRKNDEKKVGTKKKRV